MAHLPGTLKQVRASRDRDLAKQEELGLQDDEQRESGGSRVGVRLLQL